MWDGGKGVEACDARAVVNASPRSLYRSDGMGGASQGHQEESGGGVSDAALSDDDESFVDSDGVDSHEEDPSASTQCPDCGGGEDAQEEEPQDDDDDEWEDIPLPTPPSVPSLASASPTDSLGRSIRAFQQAGQLTSIPGSSRSVDAAKDDLSSLMRCINSASSQMLDCNATPPSNR